MTSTGFYKTLNISFEGWACSVTKATLPRRVWNGQVVFEEPDSQGFGDGINLVNLFHKALDKLKEDYGKPLDSDKIAVSFNREKTGKQWIFNMEVREYE